MTWLQRRALFRTDSRFAVKYSGFETRLNGTGTSQPTVFISSAVRNREVIGLWKSVEGGWYSTKSTAFASTDEHSSQSVVPLL